MNEKKRPSMDTIKILLKLENLKSIKKIEKFDELIADFFEFYRKFDYKTQIISTFHGYALQKDPINEKSDRNVPMAIEAPLKRRCIISKYVTQKQVDCFQNIWNPGLMFLAPKNYRI